MDGWMDGKNNDTRGLDLGRVDMPYVIDAFFFDMR